MTLYRITLPYACYGVIVHNGRVALAPPIAKWAIGKPIDWLMAWVAGKKGTCEVVKNDKH